MIFENPLSPENYSDPFLIYDDKLGYYYFMASCQNDRLLMFRHSHAGEVIRHGESKVVYECGEGDVFGPMWAPEMIKVGSHWYIYTSCQEKYNENLFAERKRLLILKSKTEDPFDGFEFASKPDPSIFAIDPTVFFHEGVQYICYSRVDSTITQILEIRRMKDPITFTDELAEISRPTFPWEMVEGYDTYPINEGAFYLENKGRRYIIYSANGCWSDDYCLGLLEHVGGDMCEAKNWKKYPEPIFVKGGGVYGVGHASFFVSPDKEETWIAYHCLLHSNPEKKEMDRHTCIQKIGFDENGFPMLGEPIGIKKPVKAPSGESKE